MDRLNSLRLTVVFVATFILPSVLLAFFALRAISSEQGSLRARLERRQLHVALALAAEAERALAEPSGELAARVRDLGGRVERLEDLPQNLLPLVAADGTFKGLVLVEQGGEVVWPALDRKAEGPLARGAYAGPLFSLDEQATVFARAERLEFQEKDLGAAIAEYRAILDTFRGDPGVRAEAHCALGRLYRRAGQHLNALDQYHAILDEAPFARDRDGTPLGPAALLELSRCWRALPNREAARRTLAELLAFLDEHRAEIGADAYAYYRAEAIARLREDGPEGEAAAARAEASLRERAASRADVAAFRRDVLPAVRRRAAERPQDPFGFVRVGPDVCLYCPVPGANSAGESLRARGLACFPVDVGALRARRLAPIAERAGLGDDAAYAFAERGAIGAPADASAPGEADGERALVIAPVPLPPPLDDLEVRARLRPEAQGEPLTGLLGGLWAWAIALCLVGLTVGGIGTARTVLRQVTEARLKTDFVSNVTHELKTPLTSIGMFVETLQMGRVESEEERKECLDVMARETARLSKLIDKVLGYSKIEAGTRRYVFKLEDPGEVVEEAVWLFRSQMRGQPPFELEVNIVQQLSRVLMDKDAVLEVLLNLFSNAYKYSPKEKSITVNLRQQRKWLAVEVADKGIGIPWRERWKIFRKFYRVNDLLTREVEGSGIGLTIAQAIARAHRGDVTVKSKIGKGSTFTLWLPRA